MNTHDSYDVVDFLGFSLAAMIVLTNGIVIVAFSRMTKRAKSNIVNMLLFHQAIANYSIAFYAFMSGFHAHTSAIISYAWISMDGIEIFAVSVPLGALSLAVVERYISVKSPFYRRTVLTRYVIACFIILNWLVGILMSIPVNIIAKKYAIKGVAYKVLYEKLTSGFAAANHSIVLGIACVSILVLLLSLMSSKKSFNERIRTLQYQLLDERSIIIVKSERKIEHRIFFIIITMLLLYVAAYLPLFVCVLMAIVKSNSVPTSAMDIAKLIYFFNASVNPFLTISLKDHYLKILRTCFHSRSPQISARQTEISDPVSVI